MGSDRLTEGDSRRHSRRAKDEPASTSPKRPASLARSTPPARVPSHRQTGGAKCEVAIERRARLPGAEPGIEFCCEHLSIGKTSIHSEVVWFVQLGSKEAPRISTRQVDQNRGPIDRHLVWRCRIVAIRQDERNRSQALVAAAFDVVSPHMTVESSPRRLRQFIRIEFRSAHTQNGQTPGCCTGLRILQRNVGARRKTGVACVRPLPVPLQIASSAQSSLCVHGVCAAAFARPKAAVPIAASVDLASVRRSSVRLRRLVMESKREGSIVNTARRTSRGLLPSRPVGTTCSPVSDMPKVRHESRKTCRRLTQHIHWIDRATEV